LNDASALPDIDAFDGRAERIRAARADLDDHEMLLVAANEIELAESATVAARKNREALLREVIGRA
jgi:hypothetical protein